MNIQRRLHAMIDDILGQDPRDALIAFHELHDHQMPWLEQRVIALARRENWGWARIGRLLDRSRQHLHQRFSKIVPSLPHDSMAEHRRWELEALRLQAEVRGGGRSRDAAWADDDPVGW